METLEERPERSNAEDDLVALGRPLRRKYIAILVLIDRFSASSGNICHQQAGSERVGRGTAIGDEPIASWTERRYVRSSQAQFIVRVEREGFRERREVH